MVDIGIVFIGLISGALIALSAVQLGHVNQKPKPVTVTGWRCTLSNVQHPFDEPDDCVQFTKNGFSTMNITKVKK